MKRLKVYGIIDRQRYNDKDPIFTLKDCENFLELLNIGEKFEVYINSPGGSVFEGISIYNVLNKCNPRPNIHIIGEASSIASVIAMAGEKVIISESGTMLIHKPWTMALGNSDVLQKTSDELKKIEKLIIAVYRERTRLDDTTLQTILDSEEYQLPEKLLEYGFVDEVYKPVRIENQTVKNQVTNIMSFLDSRPVQYRKELFNIRLFTNTFSKSSSHQVNNKGWSEEALKAVQDHPFMIEIDNFLANNIDKLTFRDIENNSLKNQLFVIRKEDIRVNGKSLYEQRKEEIINRGNDMSDQIFDTDSAAMRIMNETGCSYEDAVDRAFLLEEQQINRAKAQADPNTSKDILDQLDLDAKAENIAAKEGISYEEAFDRVLREAGI